MEQETWADEVVRLLRQSGDGSFYRLQYFSTVDSTNEAVKRAAYAKVDPTDEAVNRAAYAKVDPTDEAVNQAAQMSPGAGADPSENAGEGLVIIGEEQTAGKGRRGRNWASPSGESIYFSILLRPGIPAEACSAVTLVAGLSVAQTLRMLYGLDARIKWPNDIVVDGKKVCGILTEGILEGNTLAGAVTGIGINVNNRSFPEEIAHRATSVRLEVQNAGKRNVTSEMTIDRAQLLASVLHNFRQRYAVFCKDGSMGALREEYVSILAGLGSTVVIEDPAGSYSGKCLGIDERGRLLIEREDGASVRRDRGSGRELFRKMPRHR